MAHYVNQGDDVPAPGVGLSPGSTRLTQLVGGGEAIRLSFSALRSVARSLMRVYLRAP